MESRGVVMSELFRRVASELTAALPSATLNPPTAASRGSDIRMESKGASRHFARALSRGGGGGHVGGTGPRRLPNASPAAGGGSSSAAGASGGVGGGGLQNAVRWTGGPDKAAGGA